MTSGRIHAGTPVGPYEVVRFIAAGGMGAIYEARDTRDERVIALKLLTSVTPGASDRFEREARIVRGLTHPNIVTVYEWDRTEDDTWYMAMELLRGESLAARMARGSMSVAEVVEVASQVCVALDYAHAQRVVHRDLTPGNVYLSEGDPLKVTVLDFGIARVVGDTSLTRTGSLLGTFSYMAPEQARGERDVDARADLWSLGAMLFEALAGRPLFTANTPPGMLYQILTMPLPDLGALCPRLPRDLVWLVQRALRRPREERISSARLMLDTLQALRVDATTEPTRVSEVARLSSDELSGEVRLATVVFVDGVRDFALLTDLVDHYAARLVSLQGAAALVVFGSEVWVGDEPGRAVRFALACRVAAHRQGVATGRATCSAQAVTGQAVDAAVATAPEEGVRFDPTTTSMAGGFEIERLPDGTARPADRDDDPPLEPPDIPFATTFVGRDLELSMLLGAVDEVEASGRTVSVVMWGVEGIGKSRLRHEAERLLAARDAPVSRLLIRCDAQRRDEPFGAISYALESLIDPALARTFTAQGRRADPQAALDHARAVFQSILRDLCDVRPLVLIVDDAQWIDPSSNALLWALGRAASDLPVAVWVFTRPEGRESFTDMLQGATIRELTPLKRAGAEQLLRALIGEAPEVVLRRADGHPLFLEQLGRCYQQQAQAPLPGETGIASDDRLPVSVEGAVLSQLDRLAATEREFLKRAAVFGPVAWVEGAAALGADATVLPSLQRAGVLTQRSRGRLEGCTEVAFRSHMTRDVAVGLWPPAARAVLHASAARWLERHPEVMPGELAGHWDAAGDTERAARSYADAAIAAATVGDGVAVATHAGRALARTRTAAIRWDALRARDDVLQLGPDRAAQREVLEEMSAVATTLTLAHQAEVAWRRCYVARLARDGESAERLGLIAIDLAFAAGASRVGAVAHIEMALLRANEGRRDDALGHATSACALSVELGDAWLVARANATLGYVYGEGDRFDEALERYAVAASGFERAGDLSRAATMNTNAGSVMTHLGRLSDAGDALTAALKLAERARNRATGAIATHNLGFALRLRGDRLGATAHQERAATLASELGHQRLATATALELGYLALGGDPHDGAMSRALDDLRVRVEPKGAPLPALAVAARLAHRLGAPCDPWVQRLRDGFDTGLRVGDRVEVAAALAALLGEEVWRAHLRDAIESAVAGVPEADRVGYRRALLVRCVIDREEAT